ncbi:hypothetical protein DFP72DRAFT_919874 [Ephemerocybe angulata]|uniref:RecF/RecN/SMC N-terminal domain-containing protein n=1 Tax=Ephemerocybe angulata TaxID=980116 RepID=A0A8H6LZ74_9AGAR|nr:hypothetical protein DFP72DRAFT_919874 [Tulosesus angulatus]
MPKRQAAAVQSDASDGSDSGSERRASPKRTRTQHEAGTSQPATQRRRAGDGGESDGDAEADIVIPVAEDDAAFEAANLDNVRASIESGKKNVKGIAEYGILQAIEVEQFMCHQRLNFKFGEQINFIIGHNGSGKSAVLSALTIALGGKTNSTGRGSGLKSFIREGQHEAKITLKIKNEGPEAFKPDQYGDSIIIQRRFNKDGGSSWKIMDGEGRNTVSTKREELSAICDHMNVQVDNPMNVLTQDSARQFLSASHPHDKYKFFLMGTQLFQLSTEYDICLENIRKTAKVLVNKKEAIPDLRRAFNEALRRFKEAEKAREQKKKVDDLKKEKAWAHVNEKKEELEAKLADVQQKKLRIPKIQEKLDEAKEALQEQEAAVKACEGEIDNLGSMDHLQGKKSTLVKELRDNQRQIQSYNNDIRTMDTSISALEFAAKDIDRKIEAEQARMEANTKAKRDLVDRQLNDAKAEIDTLEARRTEINASLRDLMAANEETKAAGLRAEAEINTLRQRISEADNMVAKARASMRDIFVPFGNNIKGVIDEIERSAWQGDKPLGPLGRYVKAREPEKWGEILRSQLAGTLTAFAITDPRDRDQLKRILQKYQNNNLIIIYEKDMFDYSAGEPPASTHTVLRALEFSDPWVVRIMINQARIESLVLSNQRKQLEEELTQLRGGFSVRVYPVAVLFTRNLRGAQNMLLTGRDPAAEIAHHEQEKARCSHELEQLQQALNAHRVEFGERKKEVDKLTAEGRSVDDRLRKAKLRLRDIQEEANEELPADTAGYLAAKAEAEDEIASFKTQKEEVVGKKAKLLEERKGMEEQLKEVQGQIDEFSGQRTALENKMNEAVTGRVQIQANINFYTKKVEQEEAAVAKAQEFADVCQEEFAAWSESALEYCAKVETRRKPDNIEREIEAVNKALKAREQKQGATVEELTAQVNKAREAMEKVDKEWRQMSDLNKALRKSLLTRLHRWQEFRRHIALRCRLIFAYHLSHRGYYGKVLFNHEAQTLTLRVQTDDQLQAKGTAEKDPRSLSGGEKSFSTICLLLSLWDSIGCPLRCLDEFDVFMDAVNRRISMKMMIDTATANPDKQYILITPQDMTNVTIGKNVKVSRMDDPQRGAGLNMTAA